MIFNEVNKSHVDNLYNDNLLVNLGSIKDSVLHDYDDKPYGVDTYAFVKVLNGAIKPIPSTVKPYFNCHYAYCSNPDKTLQIKLKVNDEWVDVGAIHGDTELSFTKSKLNIYFDKEFNGSSVVSKDNSLAFVFTSNIIPTLDNYEIYGLKLEAGLIPTKFETDVESRALAIAKQIVDNELKGHDFSTNVVTVSPADYDDNVSFYGSGTAVIYDNRMGLVTFGFRCKSKPEGSVLFKIRPSLFGWNSFKYISAIGALSTLRDNFNYPANSSFRLNSNGDVVNVTGIGIGDNNWKYFQITIPLARES